MSNTTAIALTSQIFLKIDGQLVDEAVMPNLIEVIVDQHTQLPDMFIIRLHDPDLNFIDGDLFKLTMPIEIGSYKKDGEPFTLLTGEITALEPNFAASMVAELLIRGYDQSHRLYRERKTAAFLNVRDSDLAEKIAKEASLETEIELTRIIYPHVYQHNQSDMAFLLERAERIGFECFVHDKKLYFRKPKMDGETAVTLTWGEDNLSIQPRMTLAEQVDQVIVRGWDADKQKPIVGQADSSDLRPHIEDNTESSDFSGKLGESKLIVTDQPVLSQEEADLLAAARLDERTGAFIEMDGAIFRRPDVKAGSVLQLVGLGQRFSGSYLVTSATHSFTTDNGLETMFSVSGLRNGTLREQLVGSQSDNRWFGVVPALVTNIEDPKRWGRVKVKFPWLSEETESDWARVVTPGAGQSSGLFSVPMVDDEVLVTFEHGDFSRPYVLGAMPNGANKNPKEMSEAKGEKRPLLLRSRSGHKIVLEEGDKKKIHVETEKGHKLTLDDKKRHIRLETKAGFAITLDDKLERIFIESKGDISLEASGDMLFKARGNMQLSANGRVSVRGSQINLN